MQFRVFAETAIAALKRFDELLRASIGRNTLLDGAVDRALRHAINAFNRDADSLRASSSSSSLVGNTADTTTNTISTTAATVATTTTALPQAAELLAKFVLFCFRQLLR